MVRSESEPQTRVIVFARVPRLGGVKTRLAAAIGQQGALDAHRALLERTLEIARASDARQRELCLAGEDTEGECAALARRHGFVLARQEGADLGARMFNALQRALSDGCLPVLVGSDVAALVREDLSAAFAALRRADAVFAPTEDGGYALVGLRRALPRIFEGPEWGGDRVMLDTRARLRAEAASWVELRTLWDVDDVADLRRWEAIRAGA